MSAFADRVARLPWVTRLPETVPCTAYRWSHIPVKAVSDPELAAKFKCKNRARWQFRGLPDQFFPARDGMYCWPHLLVQLYSTAEEDRTRRALARLYKEEHE